MFLPRPTVTPEWLANHLDSVAVVDTRWYLDGRSGRAAYDEGHIPRAVFLDLDEDLAAPPSVEGGRHPLPSPTDFADALARVGINDGDAIVVYDDAGGSIAARLWWMLRSLGDRVAVLDGGLSAWPGAVTDRAPTVSRGIRSVVAWPSSAFVDIDALDRLVDAPGSATRVAILDARSAERFERGDASIDPRPGHIPGAHSAPWSANLEGESQRFLSRLELRRRFEALGLSDRDDIVAYCGSGVTACHDLLALDLAGFDRMRLFPGSWSAWGASADRVAETGPSGGVLGVATAR